MAIKAILQGGPENLPASTRHCEVPTLEGEYKVEHAGGYEHFVHTGEFREEGGERLAVFRWSSRTEIAE
ncbi:MAG TPA: DUF5988 family protein [Pseudonocardiaceae bacterium]|mgnify:CR=1 FL=1